MKTDNEAARVAARAKNREAIEKADADPVGVANRLAALPWLADRLAEWPEPDPERDTAPAQLAAEWPEPDPDPALRAHWAAGLLADWPRWAGAGEALRDLATREMFANLARLPEAPDSLTLRSLLSVALDRLTEPLTRRHLIVKAERKPPRGADPLLLNRTMGGLHLATLAAVEVDGEPFATPDLDTGRMRTRRRVTIATPQGNLFPGPRTLAGKATPGAIMEAVGREWMDGHERSPLRADVLRLGTLAYALTGAAVLTDAEGAVLTGGMDTPANRRRFNRALWWLRELSIEVTPGIRWALVDSEPGEKRNRVGPARWILDHVRGITPPDGCSIAWRLTGALFRRMSGESVTRGTQAGYWGAVARTVAGIEAGLAWGPSAGRGKDGRIPDNLRPVRKGGPGPEVFIPWWQVLRLSGENVGESDGGNTVRQRYGRRAELLRKAGYFTARRGTASAGDTIEIIEQVRGSRARQAGLIVRASARYCAAYSRGGERTRISAARVLAPDG